MKISCLFFCPQRGMSQVDEMHDKHTSRQLTNHWMITTLLIIAFPRAVLSHWLLTKTFNVDQTVYVRIHHHLNSTSKLRSYFRLWCQRHSQSERNLLIESVAYLLIHDISLAVTRCSLYCTQLLSFSQFDWRLFSLDNKTDSILQPSLLFQLICEQSC